MIVVQREQIVDQPRGGRGRQIVRSIKVTVITFKLTTQWTNTSYVLIKKNGNYYLIRVSSYGRISLPTLQRFLEAWLSNECIIDFDFRRIISNRQGQPGSMITDGVIEFPVPDNIPGSNIIDPERLMTLIETIIVNDRLIEIKVIPQRAIRTDDDLACIAKTKTCI